MKRTAQEMAAAIALTILVVVATLVAAKPRESDPITFIASAEEDLQIYVENFSDTTLTVNHVTVITAGGVYNTQREVHITNGSLYINVPIEWHAGRDAVVMVGCTYGSVNFVRQVTRY